MMRTGPSDTRVVLNSGIPVSIAAVELLLDLERRGFLCEVREDRLYVLPRDHVTPADEVLIRQYRDDLVALVHHCEGIH